MVSHRQSRARGQVKATINAPRITESKDITHRRMDQITILQHLREQKALLIIRLLPTPWRVHIADATEPTPSPRRRVDRHKRIPRPIAIHLIARNAVCVIIRLDHLRPRDVLAVLDPEAGFRVEGRLVGGQGGGVPGEGLRADSGQGGDVGVVAAVDEREAEVDIVLAVEDFAAEEEVAAIEAGEVL